MTISLDFIELIQSLGFLCMFFMRWRQGYKQESNQCAILFLIDWRTHITERYYSHIRIWNRFKIYSVPVYGQVLIAWSYDLVELKITLHLVNYLLRIQ